MRKILIINWQDRTNPFFGGAEVHLHEIYGRLARRNDYEVTLLCTGYPGSKDQETLDGIRIVRSPGNRNTFNYRVKKEYLKLLAEGKKFDLVIEDMNKMPFFAEKWCGVPVIVQVHHFFGETIWGEFPWFKFFFPLYVLWGEKRALKHYSRKKLPVISVSQSTADEIIEGGVDPDKIEVIYNGLPVEEYITDEKIDRFTKPTIVYLGRIKTYKRVDILIKAMPAIRERIPDARLVIIGSGDGLPELRDLVDLLSLSGVVEFTGFISEEEKKDYLRKAWVAVNTSPKEGWGIVGMEAQACGTPAVVSDAPGLRESIIDGKTGYLFPFGDEAALADKVSEILTSDNLREKMENEAVKWAQKFTWDEAAIQTDKFIGKVLNGEV